MEITPVVSDRMLREGDEYTVMMPLYQNVPEPQDKAWMPTICPVCKRRCWYNPVGDDLLQSMGVKIRVRCTECALQGK